MEVVTCFLDGTKYCLLDTIHAKPCAKPSDYLAFVLETTDRDWKFAQKSIEKGHLLRGISNSLLILFIFLFILNLKEKKP